MTTIEQYNPRGERVSRAAITVAQQCLTGEIPPIARKAYVAWRAEEEPQSFTLTDEQIDNRIREAAVVFISGQK